MENQFQCHNLWYISFQKLDHSSSWVHGGKAVKILIPLGTNKGHFIGTSDTVIRFESAAKHDVKSTSFIDSLKTKAK
jgi:hypothetical protein